LIIRNLHLGCETFGEILEGARELSRCRSFATPGPAVRTSTSMTSAASRTTVSASSRRRRPRRANYPHWEDALTTAIIGVGSIGSALALDLTRGGEHVVLAARDEPHAQALANELGGLATAASARDAIAAAEGLITAAGFEPVKAGGAEDAARIEVPGGDLHQNGGLNGQVLGLDAARAAVAVA